MKKPRLKTNLLIKPNHVAILGLSELRTRMTGAYLQQSTKTPQ